MAAAERELEQFHYWGAAALGLLASGLIWLTVGLGWAVWLGWMVIALALIVAMNTLREDAAGIVQAVCYGAGFLAVMPLAGMMALLPGAIVYTFSKTIVEVFPRWLQGVTLLGWLLLLAAVSAFLYSGRLRRKIHAWFEVEAPELLRDLRPPERVPAVGGILLYLNFVFIAMGCFASIAHLLQGLSAPPLFLPGAHGVDHGTLADYLLWHLLDSIPGLKVPETIRWPAPLTYQRPGAGWLLLLFKVMVIVPVVSGIGHYLKDDGASASTDRDGPEKTIATRRRG